MTSRIIPVFARILLTLTSLALALSPGSASAATTPKVSVGPFGTAFTYQGRLNDGGAHANGLYDLRFTLYDALTNGNDVGGPRTNSAVPITNGLFAVTLDFGPIFDGNTRWLEIDVRVSGAGPFTSLTPLQPLTPTPYALMANAAATLAGTLPATQLSGSLPIEQLPGGLLTNGQNGVSLAGAFAGDASGLTNVNLSAALPGTLPATALEPNFTQQLPSLSGQNVFTGTNSFPGAMLSIVPPGQAYWNGGTLSLYGNDSTQVRTLSQYAYGWSTDFDPGDQASAVIAEFYVPQIFSIASHGLLCDPWLGIRDVLDRCDISLRCNIEAGFGEIRVGNTEADCLGLTMHHPLGIWFITDDGANYHTPLTLATNGNVGILNTNPQASLDVAGSGNFSGSVAVAGNLNAAALTVGTLAATNGFYLPMITNAPTAASIGGTVGSVTNHLMLNVNGALMDYWSDGVTLYSKQLAP